MALHSIDCERVIEVGILPFATSIPSFVHLGSKQSGGWSLH